MKDRKSKLAAAAFFLIISVWFLRGVVFRGEVFMTADALWNYLPWRCLTAHPVRPHNALMMDSIQTFYPMYAYCARWLSHGYVPLWNPHILCGVPFAASGAAELFYPLNAVFFAAGAPGGAFGWSALIHLLLGGLFAYMLLRVFGAGHAGSLLGGLAFIFNGWLVGWMILPNFLHAAIWLPLMICLYELSIRRRKVSFALLCGVAGAMPFLTGNAQVGVYAHLFLGVYAAYRTLRGSGGRFRAAAYWALSAAAAAALAAPQLLATYDLMQRSQRPVVSSIAGLIKSPFSIKHLILAFLPNYYGDPVSGSYWGSQNYAAHCIYMGVVATVAAAGAVVMGRLRERWFFAAAAVTALLFALGTPLNAVFAFIPGLNRLPPFRILYLYTFAVSILAGMGLEPALRAGAAIRKKWNIVWAAYLLVFIACAAIALSMTPGGLLNALKFERAGLIYFLAFSAAGIIVVTIPKLSAGVRAALIAALVFFDIGIWANWYNQPVNRAYIFPTTPSIEVMRKDRELFRIHAVGDEWIFFPNVAMYYGLFDVRGIESLYPARYLTFVNRFSDRQFGYYNDEPNVVDIFGYDSPLIDFMNVKYILSQGRIAKPGDRKFVEVSAARLRQPDARVTLNKGAMPRFFGMANSRALPGEKAVLEAATSRRFRPAMEVLLNGDELRRLGLRPPPATPDGGYLPLKITSFSYEPDDVTFTVDSPRQALLVSSEANDKGWTATVNGKPVPLLTANYLFRAIPIPKGKSDVAFRYRPAPVRYGAMVSLAASALFLIFIPLSALAAKKTRN